MSYCQIHKLKIDPKLHNSICSSQVTDFCITYSRHVHLNMFLCMLYNGVWCLRCAKMSLWAVEGFCTPLVPNLPYEVPYFLPLSSDYQSFTQPLLFLALVLYIVVLLTGNLVTVGLFDGFVVTYWCFVLSWTPKNNNQSIHPSKGTYATGHAASPPFYCLSLGPSGPVSTWSLISFWGSHYRAYAPAMGYVYVHSGCPLQRQPDDWSQPWKGLPLAHWAWVDIDEPCG